MKTKVRSIPVGMIITSVILLALIIFIIGVQGSLGRYMTSIAGSVSFSPQAKLSGELTEDENGELTLKVSGASEGQTFTVRLYYVGAGTPPESLKVGEREALAEEAAYRFFDGEGKEQTFDGETFTVELNGDYKASDFTVRVKPINED